MLWISVCELSSSRRDPQQNPIQILAPASLSVTSGKQTAQPAAQPKIRASRYP